MKTSFKFSFVRYYLNRNSQGFALPLALGIGLSLILIGTTLVLRSHSDSSKVDAQQDKSKGLNAAEIGVTRLQELLNDNRILAVYSSSCPAGSNNCWHNVVSSSSSSSSSSTPEFQQQLESSPSAVCKDVPETAEERKQRLEQIVRLTNSSENDLSTWEDLGNGYRYRLVSYAYEPPSSSKDDDLGKGILIIEGISGKDKSESRSRLQIEIPIKQAEKPAILDGDYAPGLWIRQGAVNKGTLETSSTTAATSGQSFMSNILLNDCNLTQQLADSIKTTRIPSESPYKEVERLNVKFPASPKASEVSDASVIRVGKYNDTSHDGGKVVTDNDTKVLEFPRLEDGEKTVYKYAFDEISLNGNRKIRITPGKKVIFYVNGNIDVDGSSGIEHDCTGSSNCKPTDFQIYALAPDSTPNNLDDDPIINLGGNSVLEAFVYAPNYGAGVDGTAVLKGSLWVKSWSKQSSISSNSNQIVIEQTAKWEDLPTVYQPPAMTLPQLGGISSWTQKALN